MNRSSDYYDELVIKYVTNQANKKEIKELESWLSESILHREIYESIEKVWRGEELEIHNGGDDLAIEEEYNVKRDLIWNTAVENIERRNFRRRNIFRSIGAVAAMIAIGLFLWVQQDSVESESAFSKSNALMSAVDTTRVITAHGERKKVYLPDSSLVWLNSGAELIYTSGFGIKHRKINLKGEAYFEVKKNENLPFSVNVYNITLDVLGTSFNVQAYQKDQQIKVGLLEGKVAINTPKSATTHALRPGELMTIDKLKQEVARGKFTYEETFGWKEEILSFDGITFYEFVEKLQRWYNVTIQLKGKVPNDWMLRAKYRDESLENVLKDISFNKDFTYVIQGTQLVITF